MEIQVIWIIKVQEPCLKYVNSRLEFRETVLLQNGSPKQGL